MNGTKERRIKALEGRSGAVDTDKDDWEPIKDCIVRVLLDHPETRDHVVKALDQASDQDVLLVILKALDKYPEVKDELLKALEAKKIPWNEG
jgi:UDP-N-acetylmuramyl tripeptide synthase